MDYTRITYDFLKTKVEYPDIRTLQEVFEKQVGIYPDASAVICDNEDTLWHKKILTYKELNSRANQLAYYLRRYKVSPDDVIGISAERSFAMLIGIWGIIKAGCAYLPIDPDGPVERVNYILSDSKAKLLLVQNKNGFGTNFNGQVIHLENPEIYDSPDEDPALVNKPDDLVYVIYTSGSTGRPKGVMIEHRALINRLNWMQKKFPIGSGDVILQKTPFYFDVSVWELFWSSLHGAAVSFLAPHCEKIPSIIIDSIKKYQISIIHFVPSMLNVFLEYLGTKNESEIEKLRSIKYVFASGEALLPHHVQRFNKLIKRRLGTKLINLYGPTEATIDVSYFECPSNSSIERVPIGKPIDNIQLFIMRGKNLQPPGESGELCISGAGLSRGYINNRNLTEERFVECPFIPGEKMYKTGDIARQLPDGDIEFLGREDFQVKIRGLRIELGEIESVIRSFPGIKDCIVHVKKYSESIILITAYLVLSSEIKIFELKDYLRGLLPEYMIPGNFIELDEIPLTPIGKTDINALPEPLKVDKS